jgi:hypothetical protein
MNAALVATDYENPCDWIGSYNCRTVAGSSKASNHAYGIAIDLDYGGDPASSEIHVGQDGVLVDNNPHLHRRIVSGDSAFGTEIQLLEYQVNAIEAIKNTHGEQLWSWLGWGNGDSMHFDINVSPDRCEVDWSTVGEEEMSYANWVEGWVEGLAEDPAKSRQEFQRLYDAGILEGGSGTVDYWVGLLGNPQNPEWPGFYARTELSVWGR